MRKEIRIAGFGGQGVALAGMVLGKALSIYEEMEAVMTQAYGPEARGGASSANIVLSDQPIAFPFVQSADVLVALSQEAYTRFSRETQPDAQILIDLELVQPRESEAVYSIPSTRIAEELGRRMVTNIVMLGFLTAVTGLVHAESVQRAIETTVKSSTVALNLKAFNSGHDYGLLHYPKPSLLKEQV